MINNLCIWLNTRNWKWFALRAVVTYGFILIGVLGADLIHIAKLPSTPAMIGYVLLFSSYVATGAVWSR